MEGVTTTEVRPQGKKAPFFIARHEDLRVQYTGATAAEAELKLRAFLESSGAISPSPSPARTSKSRKR